MNIMQEVDELMKSLPVETQDYVKGIDDWGLVFTLGMNEGEKSPIPWPLHCFRRTGDTTFMSHGGNTAGVTDIFASYEEAYEAARKCREYIKKNSTLAIGQKSEAEWGYEIWKAVKAA